MVPEVGIEPTTTRLRYEVTHTITTPSKDFEGENTSVRYVSALPLSYSGEMKMGWLLGFAPRLGRPKRSNPTDHYLITEKNKWQGDFPVLSVTLQPPFDVWSQLSYAASNWAERPDSRSYSLLHISIPHLRSFIYFLLEDVVVFLNRMPVKKFNPIA